MSFESQSGINHQRPSTLDIAGNAPTDGVHIDLTKGRAVVKLSGAAMNVNTINSLGEATETTVYDSGSAMDVGSTTEGDVVTVLRPEDSPYPTSAVIRLKP